MITVACITDGRAHCLRRTLASFEEMVDGPISKKVIVDDSAEPEYARWLDETYGERYEIHHHARRMGFCATWRHAHSLADASPFVAQLEDDFVFQRPVNLYELVQVMADRPHLAQISLVRQPWNEAEKKAGGLLRARQSELRHFESGHCRWMEGRLWFTTNPSLVRREALAAWGTGPECEGKLTHHLLEHGFGEIPGALVSFGYWGHLDEEPWVWHIGDERAGSGY